MDWENTLIGDALRKSARAWPDTEFVVGNGQRLTYAEVDSKVDRLAGALQALGIGRGDAVACWLTNDPWWVLTWYACCRLGAPLVAVNTRYKTEEVAYILAQSEAKTLVAMPSYWGIDYLAMIRDLAPGFEGIEPGTLDCPALPSLRSILLWDDDSHPGTRSLRELIETAPAFTPPDDLAIEDPVVIIYTSGTTGQPKGAMHCHRVIRHGADVIRAMHFEPGDVVLGHLPLYHVAGCVAALTPAMMHGCTYVAMDQWDPAVAIEIIERERVNIFGGIPTHFIDLLSIPGIESRDTHCLKTAWIGGAPIAPDLARSVKETLNFDALQAVYGMTETMGVTTLAPFDAPIEVTCANKGKVVGDYQIRVVDRDSGATLPANSDGEIQMRGHVVTLGYYKNAAATAEVTTADGWFRSGDLGQIDEDGYLMITGRAKEMFIVGGSNAYPAEIERFLEGCPDIAQAFVCGVPHPRLGEVCCAFVLAKEGSGLTGAAVIDFARGRIADYKVPRHIQILDDFPRTTTNKVQRYLLQRLAAERFAGRA